MPSPEQIRDLMDRYAATMTNKDRDGWLSTFAPDAVQVDPVGSPPNVGREAIGGFWDSMVAGADSVSFEVRQLHVCAPDAALEFTVTARTGDGGIRFDGVDVVTVDDAGLISNLRAYWDPTRMRALD